MNGALHSGYEFWLVTAEIRRDRQPGQPHALEHGQRTPSWLSFVRTESHERALKAKSQLRLDEEPVVFPGSELCAEDWRVEPRREEFRSPLTHPGQDSVIDAEFLKNCMKASPCNGRICFTFVMLVSVSLRRSSIPLLPPEIPVAGTKRAPSELGAWSPAWAANRGSFEAMGFAIQRAPEQTSELRWWADRSASLLADRFANDLH